MTPLDRAVRALALIEGGDRIATVYDKARAVLMALREPSYRMIEAGSCGGDIPYSEEVWIKMIDAALGDSIDTAQTDS